jgi:hypothetical protein
MPSRSIEGNAVASGLLFDVRNFCPYGTINATADATAFVASVGSTQASHNAADKATTAAVTKLTTEADTMLVRLKQEPEAKPLQHFRGNAI